MQMYAKPRGTWDGPSFYYTHRYEVSLWIDLIFCVRLSALYYFCCARSSLFLMKFVTWFSWLLAIRCRGFTVNWVPALQPESRRLIKLELNSIVDPTKWTKENWLFPSISKIDCWPRYIGFFLIRSGSSGLKNGCSPILCPSAVLYFSVLLQCT